MRGVYLEVYGLARDALVVAGNSSGLVLDLALDVAKVGKAPVGDMVELGPFAGPCDIWVPLRGMRSILGGVGRLVIRDVDELEDQGTACDDAASTGQEIPTDDVLEDRRLAGGLGAHNDLLMGLLALCASPSG